MNSYYAGNPEIILKKIATLHFKKISDAKSFEQRKNDA
jgi:hypothetical protein